MGRFRHAKQYWIGLTQFRTTASIVNKKPPGRPWTVWTPENVWRVAHAFQCSPQRAARRHSFALHLTPRTGWRILYEDLKFNWCNNFFPVIWINGLNVAGNTCRWSREHRKCAKMCLTSNGAHLSDIFKKWLENVMLFRVAYRCLASYDLIFSWSVHFQVINRLIVCAPPCTYTVWAKKCTDFSVKLGVYIITIMLLRE